MSSRLHPEVISDRQMVDLELKVNNVVLVDDSVWGAQRPISWLGGVGLVNWTFNVPVFTGSGTAVPFVLTVPDWADLPNQYLGHIIQRNVMSAAALNAGVVTVTPNPVITAAYILAVKGTLTAVTT